jgi:hypothetical protein
MRSACLQTSYFPQDYTGEHIAEALQETVSSWGLKPSGLVAVTTDNGNNVVKAIELAMEDAVLRTSTASCYWSVYENG